MKGAKPDRVKTQSDLPAGSTREPEEKKKWVEPGGLADGAGDTQHGVVRLSVGGMDAAEQSLDE